MCVCIYRTNLRTLTSYNNKNYNSYNNNDVDNDNSYNDIDDEDEDNNKKNQNQNNNRKQPDDGQTSEGILLSVLTNSQDSKTHRTRSQLSTPWLYQS